MTNRPTESVQGFRQRAEENMCVNVGGSRQVELTTTSEAQTFEEAQQLFHGRSTPLRLLIVEDSEDDAELLQRVLIKSGYDLECELVDTPEAMQSVLAAKDWDVIISDFVMPRFSGLAALRLLKESGIDIPFIILSGKIGEETAVEAMRAGANDYVLKGNLARLVPAIEREMADAEVRRKHRQAEDALRKSEGRYQQLLESITDYIYTTLVENGKPVATSHGPGCESVTGYTADEYAADSGLWLRMVHEDDRAAVLEQTNTIFAGKVASPLEHRIIRKDGRIAWIRNTPVAHFNRDGHLIAYDGVVTDITEHKLAEEEKKVLEQQFQQAQKLESLGVLAGGIAHDFNNILAVIICYCSLAKQQHPAVGEFVSEIETAANRAADLCRQMLIYAGKAQPVPTQVNMTALVDEMVKMLKSTIKQNVAIRADYSPDIPSIKADASQIRQVVMNLIINASEAIGVLQGEIRVSLAKTEIRAGQSDKDHLGEVIRPGWYVCLEITDTGCGMDDETRRRIFEPFYSTKFTGRGLGMSAVLSIISVHKGALQFSSQPGQGTNFKVYLPIQSNGSGKDSNITQQVSSLPWQGSGTILLAEDEEQLLAVMTSMLNSLGFTVIGAENGKKALEFYEKNAADIILVITDMGMPVMDGYELFRELKNLNPELPIIISSGFGETLVGSRIAEREVAGFLSKPYGFDQLRNVLKSVVG